MERKLILKKFHADVNMERWPHAGVPVNVPYRLFSEAEEQDTFANLRLCTISQFILDVATYIWPSAVRSGKSMPMLP